MDPQRPCNKRFRSENNLDGQPHAWAVDEFHIPRSDPYSQFPSVPNEELPLFDYTYLPDTSAFQYSSIEPPEKRPKISAVELLTSPYYPPVASHNPGISAGLCSFHQYSLNHSGAWQGQGGANMAIMDLSLFPLTKKMVELGLFICPCCSIDVQQTEGYLRISEYEAMQNLDRQYEPEKMPIVLFDSTTPADILHPAEDGNQSQDDIQYSQEKLRTPSGYHSDGSTPSSASCYGGTYGGNTVTEFCSWQSHHTFVQPSHAFGAASSAGHSAPSSFAFSNTLPELETIDFGYANEPPRVPLSGVTIVPAHGHSGRSDSQWHPRQQGKRGPFRDATLRQETAHTRKIGCCIRCRMQRIRCDKNPEDPDGICLTCKKVTNIKTGRLPCLRLKIADIKLYKPGQVPGYEWTQRWANGDADPIQMWLSSEVKVITVSEGYADSPLSLRVRRFVPQEGDKLDRSWVYEGRKKSVQVPPYALIDLQEAKVAYEDYINKAIPTTIHKVVGPPKGLLYKTYKQIAAVFRRKELSQEARTLLQSALRLWMSARLTTISCFIVGEETLGMEKDLLDETSPTPGKIPLPPVLGAQLDMVLIHDIQKRLRKDVLDQLQRIIQKNKHCNWLAIYLVIFLLLHNASLIIEHDSGYARKHGINRRFAREKMVKEYHLGANILLAHFHYCNKGSYPLSEECSEVDLKELAELTDDDMSFLRYTQQYAKFKEAEWKSLRQPDFYDNTYFYICQLFGQDWHPRDMA